MASSSSDSHVPVFIDSTLETHLAIIVSSSKTVGHLKRMIEMEHASVFPGVGDIIVKAVKVKCKGSLYHLSDSMILNSLFQGMKGTLFLNIEAEKMVEKQDLDELNTKTRDKSDLLDQLQPYFEPAHVPSNHPKAVENLQHEKRKDGSSPSKTGEEKDSKEIQITTNFAMNPPLRKKRKAKDSDITKGTEKSTPDAQIGGTGTSAETMKVKSKRGGSKKVHFLQEPTQTTEGRVVAPEKEKNKKEDPGDDSPNKKRSKKLKAAVADVADKGGMPARDNVISKNPGFEKEFSLSDTSDTGRIISSVLIDLKEQGSIEPANEVFESQTQTLPNQANPNFEPKPSAETSKTMSKSRIMSIDSQNTASSLDKGPVVASDGKKKRKKVKISSPLLRGNESENTAKFETLVVVASSQQENERKDARLDSNLVEEDPSNTQDKKKKRRKHEKKSTVEKASDQIVKTQTQTQSQTNDAPLVRSSETDSPKAPKEKPNKVKKPKGKSADINETQTDDAPLVRSSETDSPKAPKGKPNKVKKPKEKSADINKGNIETNEASHSIVVHNLDTNKINFIEWFRPDTADEPSGEPKPKQCEETKNGIADDDTAYLSENTDDENDSTNEALRYKVAVRKVPTSKMNASRNNLLFFDDIASESTEHEGSDGTEKMKKDGNEMSDADAVVLSQVSSGLEKKLSGDEKVDIASQAEDMHHADIVYETEDQDAL